MGTVRRPTSRRTQRDIEEIKNKGGEKKRKETSLLIVHEKLEVGGLVEALLRLERS